MNKEKVMKYVKWHLENFGFVSMEVTPEMAEWVKARFGSIEVLTNGLFRSELLENHGKFVSLVYDVDLARDSVAFDNLKSDCLKAICAPVVV